MLTTLSVSLNGLDSSSASTLMELITSHYVYTHSNRLFIDLPQSLLIFLPPSSTSFLSTRDSFPLLRTLDLDGVIDIEIQLPGLLRLLPLIHSIVIQVAQLPAHRFFEYAQHRTIALTFLKLPDAIEDNFCGQPLLMGPKEFDLAWFDNEPDVKSKSILSILPSDLHEHYHRGVALSQGANVDTGVDGPGVSHRWMFERVKFWQWRYKTIVLPSKDLVPSNSFVKLPTLDFPPFLLISRSRAYSYRYENDPARRRQFAAIRDRLYHRIYELGL